MMMAGPLAKGRELAKAVGPPEIVVTDAGHAAGKRMRDYEGFADPASPKNALLVECGQHWEAASALIANPKSEEHTSELQSLMRNSYAVFCLKKKKKKKYVKRNTVISSKDMNQHKT